MCALRDTHPEPETKTILVGTVPRVIHRRKSRKQTEMLWREIAQDSLNQSPVAFSTLSAHLCYFAEVTADNSIMLSGKEMLSGRKGIHEGLNALVQHFSHFLFQAAHNEKGWLGWEVTSYFKGSTFYLFSDFLFFMRDTYYCYETLVEGFLHNMRPLNMQNTSTDPLFGEKKKCLLQCRCATVAALCVWRVVCVRLGRDTHRLAGKATS